MKYTKDQLREIELEKQERNKQKYISEGREYKEMGLKDRNEMKSTSPEQYARTQKSYNIVMNNIRRL